MAGMYGCFKGKGSDSAAMASGSPDLTNQEPAEVREESSGKKKSKFKTFKKFFARKKRKEPSSGGAEAGLKASQSIDNVSKTSESNALTRSEKDKGSGSKISLGGKAMSHDSVFVCDTSEANEALGASQDSVHGKVKSLQLQLKQAIRLGSPPSLMCVKKTEDAATTSEEDGLPCSPPEYAPFHSVRKAAWSSAVQVTCSLCGLIFVSVCALQRQDQRNSSNCLHGLDNDQLPCGASSRAVSPLVVPGDFSQPASPFACLDNSAAKHKLGLRPKANNRRKPVRRLDGKTEADAAVVEKLIISTPGAETNAEEEEEEEQNSEDGIDDQLKPKVKEEEEEEEEEKKIHAEDPRLSLFRGEEGEDESEAEADVSHGLDASCRGEQSVSEEETSDGAPVPSSESSSRASPLDPPRNTPEPPAGSRERVTPSTSSTEEDNQAESGSTSGGEPAFQEKDGESSLLEEVLSSLKTPLKPCSLDGEDVEEVLEPKEEMEKKQKEVEEKEEERVDIQTASPCSVLSDLTTDDQRGSCQEEDDSVEEEKAAKEEEEALNEEEEESGKEEEEALNEEEEPVKEEELLVVEHFNNHEEETKKREEEEDKNMPVSINEDDEEEEFMNLEKEDEDEKEIDEVQQQEGEEESEAEMMREMTPPQDEEDQRGSPLEGADEVTKVADEEILLMQDEEDDFNHKSEHVEEEEADFVGEEPEKEKAGIAVFGEQEVETTEQEGEQEAKTAEPAEYEVEQEVETSEPAEQEVEQEVETAEQEVEQEAETAEPAEQEVEQEGDDVKQSANAGLPEPLRPETQHESHSQESVISPSSKTSILSINLASPSSEKSFQFSPVVVSPGPSVTEFPTAEDEEEADTATKEVAKEGSPTATPSPEETKVRFTIAPAWQRCQSLTSPSSSTVCVSSPREEEVPVKDHTSEAEPAGESVLGPGRVKAAGNPTSKSQTSPSPVKAPSPAAANTTESAATTGGNPNNPFGVRLRKTSTLLRFNSEEEEEAPVESVNPPTSCKAESPQVCSKPSASQPVCNKPALPKKPELQAEAGGKLKRFSGISDPPRADPPSWISVAKHKQKLYRENSLDEITLKKEEQEKKPSLPNKDPRTKAAESSSHVDKPETVKPPVSPEKDPKRALSPQTSAASQPFKSQLLPCPVAPKPQVPPPVAKHPSPPQKSLPPPTPVPVHPKPTSIPPSKPTSTPQTTPVPSPAFASRTTPEKSLSRSAGPPGPRGLTTPALPQDEPPWMALAKKKAKAWSEMPQIVQ
uniref:DUF4592 domain-containing protein n=1 Tax=Oryzias sinensis TaxID=183150 RepID=A0A8C7YJE4_9TELE